MRNMDWCFGFSGEGFVSLISRPRVIKKKKSFVKARRMRWFTLMAATV